MANSQCIDNVKNKIIKEFIKDEEIIQAINSDKIKSAEGLVGTHIFNYNQNPNTINDVMTFITIQVHIPESFYRNRSDTFVTPTIEIWIISNERHMTVSNIPKVKVNRNDYLSILIDKKLNGRSDFGFGKMVLRGNIEGSIQKDYLYRRMIFEFTDLNNSLCDKEE